MFYILQEDNYDCGWAALKTLLATANHDGNYLYLPNPKPMGELYSFYDLIDYAHELGFLMNGYETDEKEKITLIDGLPLLIKTVENGRTHMLVVYKTNKHYIYYVDPAVGKRRMKRSELTQIWDGKFLKIDDFKVIPCKEKRKPLLTNKEELVMDMLEIIACLSLTLGLLFVNEKYPFFLSIIFFALFAIFEIFLRSYCLYVYKKIDERTYNDSLKVKKGKMKEFYTTLEENKQYEVGINLNSIYAVMSVIFVALLIFVNGGYSLYYLFFGIIFAGIKVLFLSPLLERKNQELQELENQINDEDIALIKLIHDKAYKFGRITLLYRYVVLGITLLGITLIMALSGVISIPYIIFYLCINTFFYKNLVSGLSMDKSIKRHRQKVLHQINLLDK